MFREVVCRRWEMWFVSLLALVAAFAVMAAAPGEADASTGITSYRYTSEPGDYIGAGDSKAYYGDTSIFSLAGCKTSLVYNVSGQRDDWEADIKAPTGKVLQPGTYKTNRFGGTGVAGLDVSGDGRGCNSSTGTLTINGITFNAAGQVATLNASFVQQCEGAAPALRGKIRYYA